MVNKQSLFSTSSAGIYTLYTYTYIYICCPVQITIQHYTQFQENRQFCLISNRLSYYRVVKTTYVQECTVYSNWFCFRGGVSLLCVICFYCFTVMRFYSANTVMLSCFLSKFFSCMVSFTACVQSIVSTFSARLVQIVWVLCVVFVATS